jgi:hypothetical protein
VPVAAEVAEFEREVGGDKDFVAGGRGEDGAVVADAEADGAIAGGRTEALDGADDGLLGQFGHGDCSINSRLEVTFGCFGCVKLLLLGTPTRVSNRK